jgi:HAD superfamily hydrolase (TIGR01549 family)
MTTPNPSDEQRLAAEASAKAENTSNAPLRWVFLDVGNVILNDDPCMALIYRILFDLIRRAGHEVTFPRLLAEREELVLVHNDGRHHWTLARRYLGEEGRQRMHDVFHRTMAADFLRYNVEMAGVREMLSELHSCYRLAVASNHGPSCRPALERSGLIDYFDLIGISVEMGVEKPDATFFHALLDEAGCGPAEAVMIGDRIDNDVAPARVVGMRTIWVRPDIREKGYEPPDELSRLYFESQLRCGVSRVAPYSPHEEPDATVTAIAQIPTAVASLDR